MRQAALAATLLSSTAALAQAPFALIQEGGHLTAANSHSPQYPVTAVLDIPGYQSLLSGSLGDRWLMLWGNRCNFGPPGGYCDSGNKGNPPEITVSGSVKRFYFTGALNADACTVSQLYAAVGETQRAVNESVAVGNRALLATDDPAMFLDSTGTFVNVCNLRTGVTPPDTTGVILDYEPCDQRDEHRTTLLAGAYSAVARAYGLRTMLYTNRLTAPCGGSGNGIVAANGRFLRLAFDYATIMTDSTVSDLDRRADLAAQLAILQPTPQLSYPSVLIQSQIGGMTCDGLHTVRDFVLQNGLYGVEMWPNGDAVTDPLTGHYLQSAQYLATGQTCPQ